MDGLRSEAPPGLEAWNAWRPAEAAGRLGGIAAPWYVAGGWALDLWRGTQTRRHDDLEIAILRPQFEVFRAQLKAYQFFSVGDGDIKPLLPRAEPPADKHQVWLWERSAGAWRMDIFLEGGDIDTWVFRRGESIRRARSAMIGLSEQGVPYLKPEGVLLYKAKATRPKDESDFAACAPLMDASARLWLKEALERAHPGHPWIAALG